MNTRQYLDAAKRKLGISSDYALANHLGLTRFGVSKLRRGHVVMSPTTAAKIAEILDLDPIKVIADAELERGLRGSDAELWRRIARKVAGVTLPVAIAGSIAVPSPTEASTLCSAAQTVCVMSSYIPMQRVSPRHRPTFLPVARRRLARARYSTAPARLRSSSSGLSFLARAIASAVSPCGPLWRKSASS